jgi:hypothetical protein
MTKEIPLRDLLIIEDDPEILNFRCEETGLLLWPQIRTAVLRMMMSDMLYGASFGNRSPPSIPSLKAVATVGRSIARNAWSLSSGRMGADICFFSPGVGNQLVQGKWLNRLTDQVAMASPGKTLTVEDPFEWRWPFPRHNSRVIMQAPWLTYFSILGWMRARNHREQAQRLVDWVITRSQKYLGWSPGSHRRRQLIGMLAEKIAAMPVSYRAYRSLLERIGPKLLMINGACYGPYSTLVGSARSLGIKTAEFQHGAISAGHDGYNFAPTLIDSSEYSRTLPDYFLAYGAWWAGEINAPVEKIVIGNPHRTAKLAEMGVQSTAPKKNVLVLSDGFEFGLYVELAKKIEPFVKKMGLNLMLRPHPLDRTKVEESYKHRIPPFEIDRNPDIYTSLCSSHAIIGEVSTAVFDGIGVADRQFVWNTAKTKFGYPSHPCARFESPEELCDMLAQPSKGGLTDQEIVSVWAPDWMSNYRGFLENVGLRAN